jgi:acyl-CoA synthetase (AMP-forming)/AMP-acid ligase II
MAVQSGGLRNAGVIRDDRVAIRLGNGLDWCIAFWDQLAGAIAVPDHRAVGRFAVIVRASP